MINLHPHIRVWVAFRTMDKIAGLTELQRLIFVEDVSEDGEARYEARISDLEEFGAERAIQTLRDARFRVHNHRLSPHYMLEFWDNPAEDCVGGLLLGDGSLPMRDPSRWRIVPLSEPLYSCGRPEADSEHGRFKPHVLGGPAGGIPIVSDEFLSTLRKWGAVGDTGEIIYRGNKKEGYDKVQQGYKRFLIRPEYEMPRTRPLDFLPKEVPENFGVCCMRRFYKDVPEGLRTAGIQRNVAEDTEYEIALPVALCQEVRRYYKHVLIYPIFRADGVTHQWFKEFEAAVATLGEGMRRSAAKRRKRC